VEFPPVVSKRDDFKTDRGKLHASGKPRMTVLLQFPGHIVPGEGADPKLYAHTGAGGSSGKKRIEFVSPWAFLDGLLGLDVQNGKGGIGGNENPKAFCVCLRPFSRQGGMCEAEDQRTPQQTAHHDSSGVSVISSSLDSTGCRFRASRSVDVPPPWKS
jgi:hypothetical protein